MQDLYRRLGVSPASTEAEIQRALTRQRDLTLARDAKAVLLRPERRRAYDRLHPRLVRIAQLQARLPGVARRNLPRDLAAEFGGGRRKGPSALAAFKAKLRRQQQETAAAEPEPTAPRTPRPAYGWAAAVALAAAGIALGVWCRLSGACL
jgi:hypothetical protein